MGIQALQKFIRGQLSGRLRSRGSAKNRAQRRCPPPGGRGNPRLPAAAGNRLCLVVDGECCLDRLYGGYFSDWVCGGQWNRMVQFLSVLIQTIQNNNIELAVFFNGSLEPQRLEEWHRQQQAERRKVGQVLKHVATKATPPPKVWWIAPVCLRTCLRMALRHLNVTVLCSMDDHRQEVIAFCRENGFHGLMAEDAEYAIFDPPRYFSSAQLKLTYKGRRHESGCYPSTSGSSSGLPPISEQPAVNGKADVSSPSLDLSSPGEDGLQRSDPAKFASETAERELSSLTAYRQATGGGYPTAGVNGSIMNGAYKPGEPLDLSRKSTEDDSAAADANGVAQQNGPAHVNGGAPGPSSSSSNSSSPGRQSPKSWQGRKGQKGSAGAGSTGGEQASAGGSSGAEGRVGGTFIMPETPKLPKVPPEVMRTASERHQKGLMSPWIYQLLSQGAIKIPVAIEDEAPRDIPWGVTLFRPIRQMVYAVLFNMHHHAFVARQKREAAAAAAGTEASKTSKESPISEAPITLLFPTLATLADSKGPAPVVVVEWLGRSGGGKGASRRPYELVEGVQLGWPVPTVQRLWLGPSLDDKKCRLRAFLSCLRSDVPLMLNTAYVPQHLLIPCAVLRFLMSQLMCSLVAEVFSLR
ncbi:hypothetical protein HPB49_025332 [Dermacentor silvarum]|uniref:Uncharacterized protein n=1 Tax=Dermacentor silvarum TaxID=543639 RepID=A0ACB8DRT0_DERSI|nr:hypothetical protein HPB49_025332 [Dermacentor silvarum]